ncbi:hypothetical protein EZS27_041380 [termite gut metagenome]|uniref:Winged helix-turn helix domain-containing protein n=1 Tax=termite gut metagenome TaxID=433724 RepID=A0A5J4PC36_9ZZZZ
MSALPLYHQIYIENTFGVSYKKAQIYNLLHTLGLRFQRGRFSYLAASEREERVRAIKNLSEIPQGSVVVFEDEASLVNTATVSYQ